MGLSKHQAMNICKWYEVNLFRPVYGLDAYYSVGTLAYVS